MREWIVRGVAAGSPSPRRAAALAIAASFASACTTDSTPTYQADVRPIFEQRCQSCHQPGGIGTFDITYDAAAWADGPPAWAQQAALSVAAGEMPPWMPSQDCHAIQDSRALTTEQRDTVAAWAAANFPAGDESDYVSPAPIEHPMLDRRDAWGDPDLVLASPDPYTPVVSRPDDYRCIVVDHDFTEGTWIRGLEVAPEEAEIVHHLILYAFDASEAASLTQLDAADPEPGYACPGNPTATTVLAWAPGQVGEFLPEGIGRYVDAGTKLVMQIHYNTLGRTQDEVPGDRTATRIWLYPAGETPTQAVLQIPFPNMDIRIPAGEPNAAQENTLNLQPLFGNAPIEVPIIGVMGHMHQLGRAISLDMQRTGQDEACLLDIPEWNFSWQQSYFFPEDQWAQVGSDTTLRMTCRFDNSAANQPVVNGEQLTPRDVTWGEGTLDEMCLTYAVALVSPALLSAIGDIGAVGGGGPAAADCEPGQTSGCCGDGVCDGPETVDNCAADCG